MSYKTRYGYGRRRAEKSIVGDMQEGVERRKVSGEMEGRSDSTGSKEERCR